MNRVKNAKNVDIIFRFASRGCGETVFLTREEAEKTLKRVKEKCSYCNVVTTFKGDKQYLFDFNCPNCGADMGREL